MPKSKKNKKSGPKKQFKPLPIKTKMPQQSEKKIKVLAYCDTPSCATGFGTVSRNILEGLYRTGRYDVDVLGINYWGNPHPFPYRIWPTGTNSQNDPYGRKKVCKMLPQMEYDLLFFLQDTFILDFLPELIPHLRLHGKKFRSICYYPIDGEPKENWIKNVSVVDFPVAYCEFCKKMSEKMYPDVPELSVIPHGVNTREYYPHPETDVKSFREKYFGPQAHKFVFTNLNRNQQRKDVPRTIMAFKEFKKQVPDSILYLHMAKKDQGWDLPEVCKSFGMSTKEDIIFPENFGPNQGYPREIVNMIYNISDCVVSSCLGEGFGLCLEPNSNIYTIEGIKEIKDITVNDKVLSNDGIYNDVQAIMSKEHNDDIYEITTWLSNIPIKSSPEHGFFVCEENSYVWKKAKDLEVGDCLVFPKNNMVEEDSINVLDLIKPLLNIRQIKNIVETNNSFKIVSNFNGEEYFIPKKISITPSLMRLFGLYLAEGCVSTAKMDSIIFSFHKNETDLISFVEKEMKGVFGLECHDVSSAACGEDYKGKSIIRFYSSVVANLFYALFGSGARNKKVHSLLLNQKNELLKELTYGEFMGDGHYGETDYQLTFSTTSKNVAYSLRLILAKLGIISAVKTSRVEYKVNVTGSSKTVLLNMFGIAVPKLNSKYSHEECSQNSEYLIFPIKEIKQRHYKGKLIDIQVANSNNFVAENVIVHNSWIEAMAAKTPVLMPDNTALSEFITEDRGYLIKSGGDPSLYTVLGHDNEVIRPLVDVNDMAAKMVHIYNNYEEAKEKAENAYRWVNMNMDWQRSIAPQWVAVFDKAYEDLQAELAPKPKNEEAEEEDTTIDAEEI